MRTYNIERSGLQLQLYYEGALNQARSDAEGRPIHDKVLYGRVLAPSQPRSVVVHELERISKVTGDDGVEREVIRKRHSWEKFKRQIEDFKSEEKNPDLAGTPVENLPGVDVALAATLRSINIFTIEALAVAGDNVLPLLRLNYDVRRRAQEWLAAAKDTSQFTKLSAENERLRSQLEAVEQRLNGLGAPSASDNSDALPAPDFGDPLRRGPGRPPKNR